MHQLWLCPNSGGCVLEGRICLLLTSQCRHQRLSRFEDSSDQSTSASFFCPDFGNGSDGSFSAITGQQKIYFVPNPSMSQLAQLWVGLQSAGPRTEHMNHIWATKRLSFFVVSSMRVVVHCLGHKNVAMWVAANFTILQGLRVGDTGKNSATLQRRSGLAKNSKTLSCCKKEVNIRKCFEMFWRLLC